MMHWHIRVVGAIHTTFHHVFQLPHITRPFMFQQNTFGFFTETTEELKTQFESAYNSPRTASGILKWTGISLAGLGIVGWLAVRNS